jgi:glucokinase
MFGFFPADNAAQTILMDIGASYIRFAVYDPARPLDPFKHQKTFEVAHQADLVSALAQYRAEEGVGATQLAIATAANPVADGSWKFATGKVWMNSRRELEAAGYTVAMICDDFVARARGAITLSLDEMKVLVPGQIRNALPKAIIGVGTGLGLAFILYPSADQPFVQYNFGGHMLAAPLTDEQRLVVSTLQKRKNGAPVVPEDICSGRGMTQLYDAVAVIHGYLPQSPRPADILQRDDDPLVPVVLRLFHEFLGLFVHHVVLSGHAFGGVFFDGGVVHHLVAVDKFDVATVQTFYRLGGAQVIEEHLSQLPLRLIDAPNVTLRGLKAYIIQPGEVSQDAA